MNRTVIAVAAGVLLLCAAPTGVAQPATGTPTPERAGNELP